MAHPVQPAREITNGDLLLALAEMRRDITEIKQDGKETKEQATKTNGRVAQLESDKRIEEALRRQRAEQLAETAVRDREHVAEVGKHREDRMTLWRGCALVLLGCTGGVVAPAIAHVLGIH